MIARHKCAARGLAGRPIFAPCVARRPVLRLACRAMSHTREPAVRVVPLGAAHLARVAAMLAHAFVNDAAYAYLFPAPETRSAGLQQFFEGNLRAHLPHACTFVALDADARAIATVT